LHLVTRGNKMKQKKNKLTRFLAWSARMAGKPLTFVGALIFIFTWIILGLVFHFSNTWLLILNTIGTLNAALMVFIIQHTQIKESKALHLKIDELIRTTKEAENELMAIEELEEEELQAIKKRMMDKKI
jgi:low affinity Fe/Cu permease